MLEKKNMMCISLESFFFFSASFTRSVNGLKWTGPKVSLKSGDHCIGVPTYGKEGGFGDNELPQIKQKYIFLWW